MSMSMLRKEDSEFVSPGITLNIKSVALFYADYMAVVADKQDNKVSFSVLTSPVFRWINCTMVPKFRF